jgi:hypothetical protein
MGLEGFRLQLHRFGGQPQSFLRRFILEQGTEAQARFHARRVLFQFVPQLGLRGGAVELQQQRGVGKVQVGKHGLAVHQRLVDRHGLSGFLLGDGPLEQIVPVEPDQVELAGSRLHRPQTLL